MLCCQSLLLNWALSVFLSQNEVAKEKKGTPGEKVREVTVKASPTKGPEGARKDHASAVTEKKQKRNQRPVDKVKER